MAMSNNGYYSLQLLPIRLKMAFNASSGQCTVTTFNFYPKCADSLGNNTQPRARLPLSFLAMHVCMDNLTTKRTVQTFTSCTSRPDISQCLVVEILVDNMSNI